MHQITDVFIQIYQCLQTYGFSLINPELDAKGCQLGSIKPNKLDKGLILLAIWSFSDFTQPTGVKLVRERNIVDLIVQTYRVDRL